MTTDRDDAAAAYDGVSDKLRDEPCAFKRAAFRAGWDAAMEWRPISTAPLLTDILVCVTHSLGGQPNEDEWETVQWVDFQITEGDWSHYPHMIWVPFPPTHWLPLPPASTGEGA